MTTTITKQLKDNLIAVILKRSVRRGTFTLSSGKQSSYYIDARTTTMSAEGLTLVGQLGLSAIRELKWEPGAIGGLTLGADPVAYAIARASHDAPPAIDAFTVRKEAKAHGTAKLIEGCFESGVRAVVVEDTITTGASALRAVDAVRAAGGIVVGILALVDRQEGGTETLRKAGLRVHALLNPKDLGV